MSLRHALLGVLSARPMNGYSLARFFATSQNWVWSAPQSQIYSELKTMASDGLIEAKTQEGVNGLQTKVYSLTDRGCQELVTWAATPSPPAPPRNAFALQALYFDTLGPAEARAVLTDYIESQTTMMQEWAEHRDALRAMDTPLFKQRMKRMPRDQHARSARLKAHVFEGQVREAQARIDWAREMLDLIDDVPQEKKTCRSSKSR